MMSRLTAVAALLLAAGALLLPAPAAARSSVHVSVGIGYPVHGGYRDHFYRHHRHYRHYPPPVYYYAPPPVIYAPPPPVVYAPPPAVVYAPPPPVVYAPPGVAADPAGPIYRSRDGRQCREYQSTAVIGGRTQPVYGTACLAADGSWRIVD